MKDYISGVNHIIIRSDVERFNKELIKAVNEYQKEGCKVEVQYSMNNSAYSALVIARCQ